MYFMINLCARRQFSTCRDHLIPFIPHQIGKSDAIERFRKYDENRFFVRSAKEKSLEKTFIPVFFTDSMEVSSEYNGEYSQTQYYPIVTKKGIIMQPYMHWYPVSGTLSGSVYSSLLTYGGFSLNQRLVEEALSTQDFIKKLRPFDDRYIEDEVTVDPFYKREEIAKEEVIRTIQTLETRKINNLIRSRYYSTGSHVTSLNVKISNLKINSCLLPAYILDQGSMPPRIMPAINFDSKIFGPAPVSIAKSVTAAAVASGAFSLCLPQMDTPAKAAMICGPSLLTGLWLQAKPRLQKYINQRQMDKLSQKNDMGIETEDDYWRRRMTEKFS